MKASDKRKVSVKLDAATTAIFESLLRNGLIASGAVSQADNQNIALKTSKVSIEMDEETVSKISCLLRDGLVASGAVSDADNKNIQLGINEKDS